MIDDKKLFSAFVYGAYASGFCGVRLDSSEKNNGMALYEAYIKTGENFPENQLGVLRPELTQAFKGGKLRNYIYNQHFEIVWKDIEREAGKNLPQALKSNLFLALALSCPVNFYTVIEVNKPIITVQNIFSSQRRKIIRLGGLEKLSHGDTVSGHWNHMLEVVDGLEGIGKYKGVSELWYDIIGQIVKIK